ncbi:Uncharacterised protein [Acinetobacter baumannii]|nr:Uncharacterised protein [Acinetobacter baumannii]
MLIQRNQTAQAERGDFTQQDRVGRAVAFKHFERRHVFDLLRGFTLRRELGFHRLQRLAERQRFGLGEEVGQQFGVVIAQRVMADGRRDEIARHQLGALVDQLVERMLTVSARLAPDDRAGLVIHRIAVAIDVLAVGFHVALLEVSGKTVHVLIVRQNGFGFGAEEVVVPNTDQCQQHRQVFLRRRFGEVLIHGVRAAQQLLEVVVTDGQRDRQTDRRPQRVTAADPVPEFEHVVGIDAELGHRFAVGGQRSEVLGHVLLIDRAAQEPVARAVGVGHGFLSGEGFGRHQEQRGFRVQRLQRFGDVGAVDVGDEVHVQVVFIRAQRFGHHVRAEIRTADADVHHVGDRLAGVAFPLTADDARAELFDLGQHRVHFRHHVFAVDQDRAVAAVAQGNVQHRAIFGAVDLLTGEHRFDGALQIGFFRQRLQLLQGFLRDAVLGIVHQHLIVEGRGKPGETIAVLGEQVGDPYVFHLCIMLLQGLPSSGLTRIDIFHSNTLRLENKNDAFVRL